MGVRRAAEGERGEHERDVAFTVTNTGDRDGAEIAQLYVAARTGGVHRPAQELRAFAKVVLAAGESAEVTLTVGRRGFAVYDPATKQWDLIPTCYGSNHPTFAVDGTNR